MLLNALFPTRDIGTDPAKIRDWAQAAEGLGYHCIEVADHVFGAAPRGDWKPTYSEHDPFHETFTTMAFIAAVTKTIKLCSGVLILPQRQTGAGRQAGGRGRRPERRPVAAGRRRRLEPRRIRGARHRLEDARRAPGRADRGDAPPVDRGPRHLQRASSTQLIDVNIVPRAGAAADPDLVRRLVRRGGQARRPARRRLDADHGARRAGRGEACLLREHLKAFGRDPAKFGLEGWLRMDDAGPASAGRRRPRAGAARRPDGDALSDVPDARARRPDRDLAALQGSGGGLAADPGG